MEDGEGDIADASAKSDIIFIAEENVSGGLAASILLFAFLPCWVSYATLPSVSSYCNVSGIADKNIPYEINNPPTFKSLVGDAPKTDGYENCVGDARNFLDT